ncbi:MAG: glycerate kinase [Desulfobacteraceae bacterium]|nr:MAG: glycerate kinase [Desulfobacteraceae bacterium]
MIDQKQALLSIFQAGINAVNPYSAIQSVLKRKNNDLIYQVEKKVRHLCLDDYKNVFVTGCGKAAAPMIRAVESLIGDRITSGIVSTKHGHTDTGLSGKITLVEAGHPVPDEAGLTACRQSLDMLDKAAKEDLVIALISGGGSALWPQPVASVSFSDKQHTNEILVGCGADIHEINCVRSHLSGIKGGQAAKAASPATVLVLVMSDVVGDDLGVIASGPFAPSTFTYKDALKIVEKYHIGSRLPNPVIAHLEAGAMGSVSGLPQSGASFFKHTTHLLCATNEVAKNAAAKQAEKLGYSPVIIDEPVIGEARHAAKELLKTITKQHENCPTPLAIISGGETTVTLPQVHGKGGRNQEFALAVALELDGTNGVAVGSCGTDGNDGPTDAAGAIADGSTLKRAKAIGLDGRKFLETHDAYSFFGRLDDLIITGPTNTNVMDIQCALID